MCFVGSSRPSPSTPPRPTPSLSPPMPSPPPPPSCHHPPTLSRARAPRAGGCSGEGANSHIWLDLASSTRITPTADEAARRQGQTRHGRDRFREGRARDQSRRSESLRASQARWGEQHAHRRRRRPAGARPRTARSVPVGQRLNAPDELKPSHTAHTRTHGPHVHCARAHAAIHAHHRG